MEKLLIRKLKSGQKEAFDTLYYKYHKKLFAFILKFSKNWHDSEDLVQKIFVIIWEKRENIDENKSFNSYLFAIARNEVYDLLSKRVRCEYNDAILTNVVENSNDGIEEKRVVETVYQLVQKLPERRRQIFLLNRESGLTYKQIAKRLGISENTVDTQIRNSLNFLRKELPKYINPMIIILLLFYSK